mmetsp:Transcript_9180/g.16562  ORF Transcript_9180/g.16562 Transcript_9180/m.16562 type:complete len:231 (-) Transcript_9180:199-891(-)
MQRDRQGTIGRHRNIDSESHERIGDADSPTGASTCRIACQRLDHRPYWRFEAQGWVSNGVSGDVRRFQPPGGFEKARVESAVYTRGHSGTIDRSHAEQLGEWRPVQRRHHRRFGTGIGRGRSVFGYGISQGHGLHSGHGAEEEAGDGSASDAAVFGDVAEGLEEDHGESHAEGLLDCGLRARRGSHDAYQRQGRSGIRHASRLSRRREQIHHRIGGHDRRHRPRAKPRGF